MDIPLLLGGGVSTYELSVLGGGVSTCKLCVRGGCGTLCTSGVAGGGIGMVRPAAGDGLGGGVAGAGGGGFIFPPGGGVAGGGGVQGREAADAAVARRALWPLAHSVSDAVVLSKIAAPCQQHWQVTRWINVIPQRPHYVHLKYFQ